jgi:hypothetical protein
MNDDTESLQQLYDVVRVRGYALVLADRLELARARFEKAVASIELARRLARQRMAELRADLEHAERISRAIARDDPHELALIAQALEVVA